MTWHTEDLFGGVPAECTCPRQPCGAVIETDGCPWHHCGRKGLHHRAQDCATIQARRRTRN